LQINFIDFLRDALEFGVQVLLADQRIRETRAEALALQKKADQEAERLEKLGGVLTMAIEGAPAGDADSHTARCAQAIVKSAGDLVRAEVEKVRSALTSELSKVDGKMATERAACARALETLLLKHDLPDTTLGLTLHAIGGTRYGARLRGTTPFGVDSVIDIDIPSSSLFAHVVRVDRVLERLEVQAPESVGLLHKEVRMRSHRLERHHVAELTIGTTESTLKLRAAPEGAGAGYDITLRAEPPHVRLMRVGERDEPTGPHFDVVDADAVKLQTLYEKLAAAAGDIVKSRKALVDAMVDGQPLRQHERPAELVERLVASMAPVVQEIAWRSLSPSELVLKRLLSDDRREEIFVAKAELKRKLEPLPEHLRRAFDPLGLDSGPSAGAESPPRRGRSIPPGPPPAVKGATPPVGQPIPRPHAPTPASGQPAVGGPSGGPSAGKNDTGPEAALPKP